jgi:hypothetical protein
VKRLRLLVAALAVVCVAVVTPLALAEGDIFELVPNTAVLLAKVSSSGGGGNGGNTSSASSATNIFSPASYVDYHELGGEPTTVVDRYPFGPASSPSCALLGTVSGTNTSCQQQAACPAGQTTCYHDLVYVSNPIGLGTYSEFYKSSDGGTTFRVPAHNPYFFNEPISTEGGGGGDSHQAVGEVTHSVFFVDLSGGCVTMNVSRDLGESFSSNKLGCETNPGAIDDRQWVATDEKATDGHDVFMNFNNVTVPFLTGQGPASIVFVKSTDDGGANTPGDWAASTCNAFADIAQSAVNSAQDSDLTACPDPADENLWIAGPIVVDKSPSSPHYHTLYIPFERLVGTNFQLYVAISTDEGNHWTRHKVLDLGPHDPANIFPQLTIDTAGNLYYTWSQAQTFNPDLPQNEGETDVYYTYSQGGGLEGTWALPINLTNETGDSAIFPWLVAGSPGQVDVVLYKANSGLNPNIAFYNSAGQDCAEGSTGCKPNTTVWNAYFGQSQNALNSGPNFKLVQISDHPIHTGGICTQGTACQSGAQQNRDLLDFFTVDVDHTGAAYTTWADDNNARHDTRQFFSRQLSGNSIFKGQNIAAINAYPITDHSVTDVAGDVFDAAGLPKASCPAMDLRGTSATRNGDTLTVTLTLNAPPNAPAAITCASTPPAATGGLWGVEFWAAAPIGPVPAAPTEDTNQFGNGNFYVAYRDNPGDADRPTPGVEAGLVNSISPSFTHFEFHRYEDGAPVAPSGTCFSALPPTPCTVVMTASLSGLGIKSGSILSAVSGLSVYFFGSEAQPPGLRVPLGNSNLADAATPFDVNGTGTTAP